MKTSPIVIGLGLPALFMNLAFAANEEWTISLLQYQLATGASNETFVAAEGEALSAAPVPEGGSEFVLRALRQVDGALEETIIDRETVGAYLPTGELDITTEDPFDGPIPRTRIDRGFTVTYNVGGIITDGDSNTPLAARQVLLDHDVANYDVETIQTTLVGGITTVSEDVYGELLPAEDFEQRMITTNGTKNLNFEASNIPGDNVFQDAGMETFRLYALQDGQIAQLQLDEAKVQIWPMSDAEFTGVEMLAEYSTIPEITINLANLYPDSSTWVQVYLGEASPGTEGVALHESSIVVEDVIPRTTRLVFRDITEYFTENGLWTLEVLTETPFGTEILEHVTIDVAFPDERDTLTLRGSFQSLAE